MQSNYKVMKILNTVPEIKEAVDNGLKVYSDSTSYVVKKGGPSSYVIVCSLNGYTVGLTGLEGTKHENRLNGSKFFTL